MFKIGIIGCGKIAQVRHIPEYADHTQAELAGYYDLNTETGCRTRRDSTRFVDTLITASPEFFEKKSPKEIQEFFQRAADFLIGRVGKENIVSAVVHLSLIHISPDYGTKCPEPF